jgi:nicotinate dehydrogenase subunit A
MELQVNGSVVDVGDTGDDALIFVLRNHLGLKSPKLGCALEQCGSCKVLVDGEPTCSCAAPTAAFQGRAIETLEHFADGDQLAPVQQALLSHNAAQCGYCLSGILTAAEALFRGNPTPTDAEIRSALDDHLCRCGAQPRVLRALNELSVVNAGQRGTQQ